MRPTPAAPLLATCSMKCHVRERVATMQDSSAPSPRRVPGLLPLGSALMWSHLSSSLSLAHSLLLPAPFLVLRERAPPWPPMELRAATVVPPSPSSLASHSKHHRPRSVMLCPARTLAQAPGHWSASPPWPSGRTPWPPMFSYLRPSSARTDRRTTFATPSRTRGTSSPALNFTGGRCHRAAAVAAACSGGHNAGDRRGPSCVALRVRKGTLELMPPLVAAAGDPPRRRPTGRAASSVRPTEVEDEDRFSLPCASLLYDRRARPDRGALVSV
jgi:hypothetical protein